MSIYRIFMYIIYTAAVQLTHAFVSSRLDYCNSLLHGLHSCSIRRLQSIQNIAARLLKKLRIDYKILLFTYCAINNISPAYIQQLITPYVPVRYPRICVYSMYHTAGCNDLVEGVSVELLQYCGTIFGKHLIW